MEQNKLVTLINIVVSGQGKWDTSPIKYYDNFQVHCVPREGETVEIDGYEGKVHSVRHVITGYSHTIRVEIVL